MRRLLSLILLVSTLLSVASCGKQEIPLQDNERLMPEALQAKIIEYATREYTVIADPEILRIDTWKKVSNLEKGGLNLALIFFSRPHDDFHYYVRIREYGIEAYDESATFPIANVCYYYVPEEITYNIRMAIRKYQKEHPGEEFDLWV